MKEYFSKINSLKQNVNNKFFNQPPNFQLTKIKNEMNTKIGISINVNTNPLFVSIYVIYQYFYHLSFITDKLNAAS